MYSKPVDAQPSRAADPQTGEPCLPSYASQTLFKGQKEIVITHQGSSYRLRITRTGGLILNK